MKKLLFSAILTLVSLTMLAQQNPALKGKVVDSKSQKPLQNVVATIQSTNTSVVTGVDGSFVIQEFPNDQPVLEITYTGYKSQTYVLEPVKGETLDLGVLSLEEDITSELQLSLVTITENDLGDENTGSESTSGLLQASRDTYQQAAAFNWGQARFRIRGLDNQYGTTMINGIVMNKLYDGRPQWSNWGGLNDATRNQEFTMGSAPSDYTFGGILGTQEINTRASHYRPGTRISMSGTNTNYNWRTMGTHASGFNKKGWAFVVSASRRWAKEGYFEGTDYSANSLFASVEKKFNDKHSLNFTSIYAQNSRGKNSPNTKEVTDLMGIDYNSYWGWQDGKKRNSREKNIEEPINMLSHYWKISEKTSLNTNIAYQTGKIGNSRIDYQGVPNPDPTYYRNLPSYFLSLYENDPAVVSAQNPSAYLPGGLGGLYTPDLLGAYNAEFYKQQQIDWQKLYDTNKAAGRSVYVLYEDRTDDKLWNANTILNSVLSDNIVLNAAVNYKNLRSHNFQYMLDLLGGDYFLDVDNFGTNADQQQSNLNNPNRQVREGDKYGYNYKLNANVIDAFTQFKFKYKKIDFYLAQQFSRSEYQREGLYRNGYYPTNSYGKSKKVEFDNFGFKGGLTYKINGRHLIDFNAIYMSKAPDLRSSFSNARVNNNVTVDLKSETLSNVDLSYIIRAPKFKSRLTGFFSQQKDVTEVSFFFSEGTVEDFSGEGDTNAFVNEVVTGLDKSNYGLELGLEYQITSTIKAMASATYAEYIYSNNPNVYLSVDNQGSATNTNTARSYGKAYLKDYHLPGVANNAASIGLEYRDPKFWWVGVNYNYLSGSYLDISPLLRTNNFLKDPTSYSGSAFPEITQDRLRQLLKQEQLDDIYLLNLQGGKSWRISNKNRNTFGFFASINNVLDKRYKTGGYEQARNANYRELNQDVSSGNPAFAPKYFYGYGRTYFVNFYINF
ncbi:carboxypeptidase-like regulatory domain-containing protein [Flavobacterium haoranii]|uniref:CarboxypepD_reg-like domain-containing protein n=1 Tax=Flavobacterium haoranii TaxID=683124 RepID=A0A1M6FMZ5_9FLAO|nr:carboxypeptidase-like regulatory domain-containing protein [Flavobacterium haoranii]SHI99081.1 CarboxypepD_reg-like domain-containing protein [Flavobacterium haoranii]